MPLNSRGQQVKKNKATKDKRKKKGANSVLFYFWYNLFLTKAN